jgi:hypothetical protein
MKRMMEILDRIADVILTYRPKKTKKKTSHKRTEMKKN